MLRRLLPSSLLLSLLAVSATADAPLKSDFSPSPLDRLLQKHPLSTDEIRRELAEPYKFGVVGDTALSTPSRSGTLDQGLRIPSGTTGWVQGFSDIGLRLAFTAPDENLPEKLKALVRSLCMTANAQ